MLGPLFSRVRLDNLIVLALLWAESARQVSRHHRMWLNTPQANLADCKREKSIGISCALVRLFGKLLILGLRSRELHG